MSKTLKMKTLVIMFVVGILFAIGITVSAGIAVEYSDLKWHTINWIVEKGQSYNERFITHIDGLTYTLTGELPNGLSLTDDGRIAGTVGQTQTKDYYIATINIYYRSTYLANYSGKFKVVDDLNNVEWVNFNNLFMGDASIDDENSGTVHTKDGFLIYSETLANYINYNSQTKTYNVTLTQDFTSDEVSNYIELIFNESEHNKYIKFEMLENTGFYSFSPYLIEIADYHYTHNTTDLYSAFFYVQVDKTYTGENRHLKIKASNPENSSQYRYINFTITDNNRIFVAFETNGGSSISSMQKEIGDTITLPKAPTKEGWIFDGWYTNSNLTTKFNTNTELTTNTVLYAKWKNDYKFVEGSNQKYVLDKDENAKFKINANFELLNKVFVDNTELDSSKYLKAKGSTIITLLKSYIKSLDVGEHTLKVTYTDGQIVQTKFTISEAKREKDKTPKTGEISVLGLATITAGLSVMGIITLKKEKAD